MTKNERDPDRIRSRSKVDPPAQPVQGDHEDVTSGSEGGGPRVGYSETDEADSDRHQFPHPRNRKH
jgi:hypothetical protein